MVRANLAGTLETNLTMTDLGQLERWLKDPSNPTNVPLQQKPFTVTYKGVEHSLVAHLVDRPEGATLAADFSQEEDTPLAQMVLEVAKTMDDAAAKEIPHVITVYVSFRIGGLMRVVADLSYEAFQPAG